MSITSDSSVKPTVIIGADSRFGTTFLSTKYRDKAVRGEALMDKTTGELYIKRVSDGKIVSFYQNKKMINDLVLELRMLLINNKSFIYPKDSESAFFISTNYDLVTINNETLYNLITDNVIIEGGPDDINKLIFTLSNGSNGFFCRSCTRDIDKPFTEWLTSQYNYIIKNYTGDNEDYLTEVEKFNNIEKWEDSNTTITYDVTVIKDENTYTYTDIVSHIRLNDNSLVLLPEIVYSEVDSFDAAVIEVKGITFDKIHFMIAHKDDFDDGFLNNFNKLIADDDRIELGEFNISHFINSVEDVSILGNEVIVALLTVKHITEYMEAMRKLIEPPDNSSSVSVEISNTKPEIQCLWFKPY